MALTQKKKRFRVVAAIVAAGVAFGLWKWLAAPKIPKEFGYGNGRIEATTVEILAKFSARIEEILVREGDRVTKGPGDRPSRQKRLARPGARRGGGSGPTETGQNFRQGVGGPA
jgi:hypothetical protein